MIAAALLLWAAPASATPPRLYIVDAWRPAEAKASGLWRPTTAQAAAARTALRRYLAAPPPALGWWHLEGARAVAARFDDYLLQAEGVRAPTRHQRYGIEGDGRRQIHLDGFCPEIARTFGDRGAYQMQIIMDGGACVFDALYDVATDRIVAFAVNGEA